MSGRGASRLESTSQGDERLDFLVRTFCNVVSTGSSPFGLYESRRVTYGDVESRTSSGYSC